MGSKSLRSSKGHIDRPFQLFKPFKHIKPFKSLLNFPGQFGNAS
jgi:hypothetical protein